MNTRKNGAFTNTAEVPFFHSVFMRIADLLRI